MLFNKLTFGRVYASTVRKGKGNDLLQGMSSLFRSRMANEMREQTGTMTPYKKMSVKMETETAKVMRSFEDRYLNKTGGRLEVANPRKRNSEAIVGQMVGQRCLKLTQ